MSKIENIVKKHIARNSHTECSYPNCREMAIYSHAISRSISLKSIAEDNHLLFFKPKRVKDVKNAHFKKIGIKNCSGFNGFCKYHDDIFQEIDNSEITTSEHIKLQVYRSLCFELHKENVGKFLIPEFTNEHAIELLINLKIINDKHEATENQIKISKNKLKFIASELFEDKKNKVENIVIYVFKLLQLNDNVRFKKNNLYTLSTENFKHQIFYYMAGFQIPVALNAKSTLSIENGLNYYFMVVPYTDSTLIMGIIPDGSPEFIQEKINRSFLSKLSVIKFVESIISSNDGWYMQPSIIEKMSPEKRAVFLSDCMFINERKFYEDYDVSIFDDLKKCIFRPGDKDIGISYVPKRMEHDKRYKNMMDVIFKSVM